MCLHLQAIHFNGREEECHQVFVFGGKAEPLIACEHVDRLRRDAKRMVVVVGAVEVRGQPSSSSAVCLVV